MSVHLKEPGLVLTAAGLHRVSIFNDQLIHAESEGRGKRSVCSPECRLRCPETKRNTGLKFTSLWYFHQANQFSDLLVIHFARKG